MHKVFKNKAQGCSTPLNKFTTIQNLQCKGLLGGILRKYLYGDAQSRLQNVDHLYTWPTAKTKQNKTKTKKQNKTKTKTKNTRSLPHLYEKTNPSLYHFYWNDDPLLSFSSAKQPIVIPSQKVSSIYLEQFQNHPIGIPNLMKMHLKTFEHPRTPCFRE